MRLQTEMCNKVGFMKLRAHLYAAEAAIMHPFSHWSHITATFHRVFIPLHSCRFRWGSRGGSEWDVLFAHTCQKALPDNTVYSRAALSTSLPLGICRQIPFHSDGGSGPHSAVALDHRYICGPAQVTNLLPVVLFLFVSVDD